jgi:hypothetical protein
MSIGEIVASLTLVTVAMIGATSARAADPASEPPPEAAAPPDQWTFTLAPYLWAAGLDGDIGLFGRQPLKVDMSFGDVLSDLRFGGMLVGELHNGTWGLLADLIYVKTEADQSITRAVLGVPVTLAASVESTSVIGTVMGEYRAVSTPTGTLDVMAGARIWSVDNDIGVALGAGGPALAAFSGSDGSTWVDPMVGARGRIDLDASWYLTGWGMVGGFGAGSEVTWDVLGGVGYEWNEKWSVVLGYRALGVDYDNGGFVYDIVQHGPILGAVMRF